MSGEASSLCFTASPSLIFAPYYVMGQGVCTGRPARRGARGSGRARGRSAGRGGQGGRELGTPAAPPSECPAEETLPAAVCTVLAEVAGSSARPPWPRTPKPRTPALPRNSAPRPGHGSLLTQCASQMTSGRSINSTPKKASTYDTKQESFSREK